VVIVVMVGRRLTPFFGLLGPGEPPTIMSPAVPGRQLTTNGRPVKGRNRSDRCGGTVGLQFLPCWSSFVSTPFRLPVHGSGHFRPPNTQGM